MFKPTSIFNGQPLWMPNTHQLIIFNLVIAMLCIYIQFSPSPELYAFEPLAIQDGELYRIASGLFYHHNGLHMFLNLICMALFCFIFTPKASEFALVSSITCIVLMLFATYKLDENIVGISGITHSLVAYFSLKSAITKNTSEHWLILLGLIMKISHESIFGSSEILEWLIGGAVSNSMSMTAIYVAVFILLCQLVWPEIKVFREQSKTLGEA
ncbi:hypothetical protein NTH44_003589 [Vibrio metoecus]